MNSLIPTIIFIDINSSIRVSGSIYLREGFQAASWLFLCIFSLRQIRVKQWSKFINFKIAP